MKTLLLASFFMISGISCRQVETNFPLDKNDSLQLPNGGWIRLVYRASDDEIRRVNNIPQISAQGGPLVLMPGDEVWVYSPPPTDGPIMIVTGVRHYCQVRKRKIIALRVNVWGPS